MPLLHSNIRSARTRRDPSANRFACDRNGSAHPRARERGGRRRRRRYPQSMLHMLHRAPKHNAHRLRSSRPLRCMCGPLVANRQTMPFMQEGSEWNRVDGSIVGIRHTTLSVFPIRKFDHSSCLLVRKCSLSFQINQNIHNSRGKLSPLLGSST